VGENLWLDAAAANVRLYNCQVPKPKYYVVWKGRQPGIYPSWAECERQVKGYVGAEFKAFASLGEARAALAKGYEQHRGRSASLGKWKRSRTKPVIPSLCVDAACSGSPGWLEYRGVETETEQQLFRAGPFAQGTNNVGEFLAIVEALRWVQREGLHWPIYSDSENAITWIRHGKCNTKLKRTAANRKLFDMIAQAETDLRASSPRGISRESRARLLKWDTKAWGEIPADFGRK
jgi:ribonuclease HI